MTITDVVIGAVIERLQAIKGVELVELEPAGDPDVFPSFAIYDGGWTPLEREGPLTRREMSVTIEGYVERGDGKEASAERNALHAALVAALMADDTLGGLVELIEDGQLRKSGATLAERRRLGFSQDFTLQFTTLRTDPGQAG